MLCDLNFDKKDRPFRNSRDDRFHCTKCPKTFPTSAAHMQHLACHHFGFRFYCVECDQNFSSKTMFDKHSCAKESPSISGFAFRKFSINLGRRGESQMPPPTKKRRIENKATFSCHKCEERFSFIIFFQCIINTIRIFI